MQHEMLSVLSDALFERNLPPVSLCKENLKVRKLKVGTPMEPKHSITEVRSSFMLVG